MGTETLFSNGPVDGYADGEEPIVFHHKDGEFRKYESKEICDMATGKNVPKRGLFRVLVSTKMNRTVFLAMMLTFGVVLCVSMFGKKSNEDVVDGVFCSLSAFSFGDDVYVSVDMREKSKNKNDRSDPVKKDLTFDLVALDSDGADSVKLSQQFSFDSTKEEQVCRFSFWDYDIVNVKVSVACSDISKELSCKVLSR